MSSQKKANIYDVAKLAGVSHQTVSRVINNHQSVRPITKQRVQAAMKELDYHPSFAARSLVTTKSRLLAFLVSDTVLYGPVGMNNAMERQARQSGYLVITVSVIPENMDSLNEALSQLSPLQIEGLVTIALPTDAVEVATQAFPDIPMVALDTHDIANARAVGIDNLEGGYQATKYLLELGHKKILHVAGLISSFEAGARRLGYEKAMNEFGYQPYLIQGDWRADTGFSIGVDLNLQLEDYTAIFAANDYLALGLMKAFRLKGIDVPGDISVIGFDDIPEASFLTPALTTMRHDFNRLGAIAMNLMLAELSGKEVPAKEVLIPEIVVRESAARLVKKAKQK
jgi:DNA-binding LacI/PurR family transcriptional regulator